MWDMQVDGHTVRREEKKKEEKTEENESNCCKDGRIGRDHLTALDSFSHTWIEDENDFDEGGRRKKETRYEHYFEWGIWGWDEKDDMVAWFRFRFYAPRERTDMQRTDKFVPTTTCTYSSSQVLDLDGWHLRKRGLIWVLKISCRWWWCGGVVGGQDIRWGRVSIKVLEIKAPPFSVAGSVSREQVCQFETTTYSLFCVY